MQTDTAPRKTDTPDKHARLTRLAVIANTLVWVVLVFFILTAVGRWNINNAYLQQTGQFVTFGEEMQRNPAYAFGVIMDIAGVLIQGVIYALVLKGISLGLFMIVETDLNFRTARDEEAAR